MLPIREIATKKDLFVAAHRGSSGTAPENTIAAYLEAIKAGADIVEADVQMTQDRKVIAFHDKNISRTTEGSGRVKDMNYDEFKDLDAGSWFSDKYKGEHIPLLSEIIRTIKGKCYLNIEVKNIEGDDFGEKIEKIIEVIHKEDYQDFTIFSSFYYNTLYQLKQKYPDFPTAAIRIPKDTRLPSVIAGETGCEAFICSIDEMTEDVADDIKSSGMFAACYLVDSREDLDRVLKLPVRGLVTNYPAKIKSLLKK